MFTESGRTIVWLTKLILNNFSIQIKDTQLLLVSLLVSVIALIILIPIFRFICNRENRKI